MKLRQYSTWFKRVVAPQGDGGAILLGELGTQDQRPVIQALADDLGAEAIGGGLQRLRIRDPQEGIVVFAETDPLALQFAGDEVMTVDPVAGLEGQKGADAQDHGAEHFVANVEVVVRIAGPLPFEDAVIGIVGRDTWAGSERKVGPCSMALEDEVDAEALAPFHGEAVGPDDSLPS